MAYDFIYSKMKEKKLFITLFILLLTLANSIAYGQTVSVKSLLSAMINRSQLATFPDPSYQQLEASSYNRASVSPYKSGWFADSDGNGYIREDTINGKKEYIIMEHKGPGCITRMWTPFFYYSMNNHIGPNISIYIDDEKEPVIKENLIQLLTGKSFVKAPFANLTTRAGVFYFPIPFQKKCIVTLDEKPFYYSISYRAYEKGTKVRSFSINDYKQSFEFINQMGNALTYPHQISYNKVNKYSGKIKAGDSVEFVLPEGMHAIKNLRFQIHNSLAFGVLRNILLKITFDSQITIWCPLGDFFCSANKINNFHTRHVQVIGSTMMCNWVMPYQKDAKIELVNFSNQAINLSLNTYTDSWHWNENSMYFHANWCDYGYLPGNKFFDLNFIHTKGKGLIIGDALTVLSPGKGWWGEGDEKIYISKKDIARHFPSQYGTGTEDYYGWAGGVVPTGIDTFSIPFGANVSIGNTKNPQGYNSCIRDRVLDAIPFEDELKFDMEASPGVDIRNAYNLLSYSMVTYWYGTPGAVNKHQTELQSIKHKLMTVPELEWLEQEIKAGNIILDSTALYKRIKTLKGLDG